MVTDALREYMCTHLQIALYEHATHRTRPLPFGSEFSTFFVYALVQASDFVL